MTDLLIANLNDIKTARVKSHKLDQKSDEAITKLVSKARNFAYHDYKSKSASPINDLIMDCNYYLTVVPELSSIIIKAISGCYDEVADVDDVQDMMSWLKSEGVN